MTIDERLDRLTDRHEALTQSLELNHLDVVEHGKQIAALTVTVDTLVRVMEKTAANVDALVSIVTNHQQRLDRIEGV